MYTVGARSKNPNALADKSVRVGNRLKEIVVFHRRDCALDLAAQRIAAQLPAVDLTTDYGAAQRLKNYQRPATPAA